MQKNPNEDAPVKSRRFSIRWIPTLFGIALLLFCTPTIIKKFQKKRRPSEEIARIFQPKAESMHYVSDSLLQFIANFPHSEYKIVKVKTPSGSTSFFIDHIDDYIKRDLSNGRCWEGHISELIKTHVKPGTIAVDIGAHIGTHTIELSRAVGSSGKVYAFEPQPKIFRELLLNMAINCADNIEFFKAAIGPSQGEVELSPLNRDNEGAAFVGKSGTNQFVPLLPLDDLKLTNVSLIKIDVEGMEIEVLEGAKNTILENKPVILVEIYGGVLPETGTPEQKAEIEKRVKYVEGLGYKVTRLLNFWDYLALPK